MQAIEFETWIDKNGHIFLPEKFRHVYGKSARLLVLLPDQKVPTKKQRRPGSAKGILQILSEDDEHLNDFKVYMPSISCWTRRRCSGLCWTTID